MYELWFRAAYEKDIQERRFTSAIRPGNRLPGNDKAVPLGEKVKIKILKQPGIEGRTPAIFSDFECVVQIRRVDVFKIRELTSDLLKQCSQDARDPELVKYHLGLIYNREFTDDEDVTLISWDYLT